MADKSIDAQIAELNAKRNERDRPKVIEAKAVLAEALALIEKAQTLTGDLPSDGPFVGVKRAVTTLTSTFGHARTQIDDALTATAPKAAE